MSARLRASNGLRACLAGGVIALGPLAGAAGTLAPAHGQARVYEPARGSPERGEILDALRPLVAGQLNPPIEFVVLDMRVLGDWAFVQVKPQRPGGTPIDLRQTPLRGDADMMDGVRTEALLTRSSGRWYVREHAIGATDVWWAGFCGQVPHALLADVC